MDSHPATKAVRQARRALIAIVVSALMAAAAAATLVGHEVLRMAWPTGAATRAPLAAPHRRELRAVAAPPPVEIRPDVATAVGEPRAAEGKPQAHPPARPVIPRPEAGPRRRPALPKPRIVDGAGAEADVERQDLSRSAVHDHITRHRDEIRACYESALSADSTAAGVVEVQFTINPEGTVASAEATAIGMDREVSRCVRDAIASIVFPRSASPIRVSYPVKFVRRSVSGR
jgi:outer membrane biosynthesis protein TonB